MKTYSPKPEHIEHRWYVVDASGVVLGRLASEVATILRGKHKPMYAPHMDTGDHVVVVNADKIELTGNKGEDKYAYRHSGYPGGIRAVKYKDLMSARPVAAVEKAVRGMLPKNTIGRQMLKKLHVVPGPEHPHQAQSPVALALGGGLPGTVCRPSRRRSRRSRRPSLPRSPRRRRPSRRHRPPSPRARPKRRRPRPSPRRRAPPRHPLRSRRPRARRRAPARPSRPPRRRPRPRSKTWL